MHEFGQFSAGRLAYLDQGTNPLPPAGYALGQIRQVLSKVPWDSIAPRLPLTDFTTTTTCKCSPVQERDDRI